MCGIPTVSIIIPVYNTPINRLMSCIESILVHEYIGIEIILVDDGSCHEVRKCLELLNRELKVVKLVNSHHRGVSFARNLGTRVAHGTYVMYVDSDDEITPGSIAQGIAVMEKTSADIVFGFLQRIRSEEDKNLFSIGELNQTYEEVSIEDLIEYHFKGYIRNHRLYHTSKHAYIKIGPVARLIRRELAVTTPFPEGVAVSEDTVWNIDLLLKCKKAVVVRDCWYWYWTLPGSTVRHYRQDIADETIHCLETLREVLGAEGMNRYLIGYLARSAGEVNRMAKYYSMPDCPMAAIEKRNYVRCAYDRSIKDYIDIKRILASGDIILMVKLLLCRTEFNIVVFDLYTKTGFSST